jgi:mono/diheme cytochrome c family protein
MMKLILTGLAVCVAATAAVPLGDATRGAGLFRNQKCVTCHSINGEGGKGGPDLGRSVSREYTPALLASVMWNHAPAMWSAMEKASIAAPKLDSQQAADLFAYFFAARFFEQKGDAGRGRKAFAEKGCAQCHNIGEGNGSTGTAVLKWAAVTDPIELARQMWNHSPQMKTAMAAKGVKMPAMTALEMNDITVYLQNLPGAKSLKPQFSPASAATGAELFAAKGCVSCHKGEKPLGKTGGLRSGAELAAAMWNHPGKVPQRGELRPEEMKRLVGYLWALQFADEGGVAARGAKAFEAKGCGGCHGPSNRPKLAHGEMDHSFGMVAVLWSHGPAMQKQMSAKGVQWPRFVNSDMADVLAFLRTAR